PAGSQQRMAARVVRKAIGRSDARVCQLLDLRQIQRSSAPVASGRPAPTQCGKQRGARQRLLRRAETFGVEVSLPFLTNRSQDLALAITVSHSPWSVTCLPYG